MEQSKIDETLSLLEILRTLWTNRLIFSACIFFFTAIAIVYAFFIAKPQYESNSRLVTHSTNNSSQLFEMAAMAGLQMGKSNNIDPSEYLDQVIIDEEFVNQIINKKWKFKNDSLLIEEIWKIKPDTSIPNSAFIHHKKILNKFRDDNHLQLVKDKKTGVLSFTTRFCDPFIAFELNKYVLNMISKYIHSTMVTKAKEKKEFILSRVKETESALERDENKLAKFKENNFSSRSPQMILEEERLSRNVMINREVYLQLVKQYEMTSIEEKNDQPLLEVIKRPEISIEPIEPKKKINYHHWFYIRGF